MITNSWKIKIKDIPKLERCIYFSFVHFFKIYILFSLGKASA